MSFLSVNSSSNHQDLSHWKAAQWNEIIKLTHRGMGGMEGMEAKVIDVPASKR